MLSKRFEQRMPALQNEAARRLFNIIESKSSNLALALDAPDAPTLLNWAEQLSPMACMLKIHADMIPDWTPDTAHSLRDLADQHQCLLFEDRKFADIGSTNRRQFTESPLNIHQWADIVSVHVLAGLESVQALAEVLTDQQGLLLLSDMSCAGHLMNTDYQTACRHMAQTCTAQVMGLISQRGWPEAPEFLTCTPGVHLNAQPGDWGQRYRTPEHAILTDRCDVIIVGNGITSDPQPKEAARRFQEAAWQAWAAHD